MVNSVVIAAIRNTYQALYAETASENKMIYDAFETLSLKWTDICSVPIGNFKSRRVQKKNKKKLINK